MRDAENIESARFVDTTCPDGEDDSNSCYPDHLDP